MIIEVLNPQVTNRNLNPSEAFTKCTTRKKLSSFAFILTRLTGNEITILALPDGIMRSGVAQVTPPQH